MSSLGSCVVSDAPLGPKELMKHIREKREKELQLKLKKEKDKERLIAVLAKNKQRMVAEKEELRTAAAEKKQRIAAEKVDSKERYGKLLSELETQMKDEKTYLNH